VAVPGPVPDFPLTPRSPDTSCVHSFGSSCISSALLLLCPHRSRCSECASLSYFVIVLQMLLRRLPAAVAARAAGWRQPVTGAAAFASSAASRLLISRSCARNASSTAARSQSTLSSAVRPSADGALSSGARLGRHGDEYLLSPQAIADFHKLGYIHVKGVLTEQELRDIEEVYMRFMRREIPVPGKDLCDMSGDFDRPFEEFSIINAMLPRVYFPQLKGNLYERRAASITRQLFNDTGFDIDYDQLLAKKPTKSAAPQPQRPARYAACALHCADRTAAARFIDCSG
jgi:hypothetical protein